MNAFVRLPAPPRRVRRERLVQRHLEAAERILAALDTEDGDSDLEPSLAGFGGFPGSGDDREADYGGLNAATSDDEPYQGWTEAASQRGRFRAEYRQDDDEPSLGSVTAADSWNDQRWWAAGGDQDEREAVSEDEGAQCEDEGEPAHEAVPTYPNAHNQLAAWPDQDGVDGYGDPDDEPGELTLRCEVGLTGGAL